MTAANRRTREFKAQFDRLPTDVQQKAKKVFSILKKDPRHPVLERHFLEDTPHNPPRSWAVRIDRSYRAVAFSDEEGTNVWYWIGSHADYDRRFSKGRKH